MARQPLFSRQHADEVLRQLVAELGGEYDDREGWRQDKVRVHVDSWTVTFDLASEPGWKMEKLSTRLRAPYVNTERFNFAIYHMTLWDQLKTLMGGQDVRVGDPELDDNFIVRSNNEAKVRELLANESLRRMLKDEPRVVLHVRPSQGWFDPAYPPDVDMLELLVDGEVTDLARLKRLFWLFATTLHQLCAIGLARDECPDFEV